MDEKPGKRRGQPREDRRVGLRNAAARRGIDQHEREIRLLHRGPRALDAERFDRIVRGAEAGRIDDRKWNAVDLDLRGHGIAGRAGDRGDDRNGVAGQVVQEARLADVGASDQDDRDPFAQQRALLRARLHARHLGRDRGNLAAHVGGTHELDVLVREIERGLDIHPQLDQRVGECPDLARERAG